MERTAQSCMFVKTAGKLRHYPYNINWNYGMLPQTWEDPNHENKEAGGAGDNDPVDVVEIGSATCDMGGVYTVKPLGIYAMIDDGCGSTTAGLRFKPRSSLHELDWKIIALRTDDPLAAEVNTLEDVEKHFPGELQKVLEWFRDYKIPDGKPANKFGLDEVADQLHRDVLVSPLPVIPNSEPVFPPCLAEMHASGLYHGSR
eukprot:scaffold921_cov397-Prasinococcus_capsulatus_cf.AAC.3